METQRDGDNFSLEIETGSKKHKIEVDESTSKEMDATVPWTEDDFPRMARRNNSYLSKCLRCYSTVRGHLFTSSIKGDSKGFCSKLGGIFGLIVLLLLDAAYVVYACICNGLKLEDDVRLLWLSCILWCVLIFTIMRKLARLGREEESKDFRCFAHAADRLHEAGKAAIILAARPWKSMWQRLESSEIKAERKKAKTLKVIAVILMILFCVSCLVFFVILKDASNLISLTGIFLLLLISVAISRHPGEIRWQPVFVGLFIQFVFALITLQTRPGYVMFEFLGLRLTEFLDNSKVGGGFVFGNMQCFAVSVFPAVIFISSVISIMFHLGILTFIICKPARAIQMVMNTTGPETINAIANIFMSQVEAPLLTRPYINLMTSSELHAIIVNGYASVSGSVLGAYIGLGVPPNHLLIACVLSAPAALAISKVIHPETRIAPLASTKCILSVQSPYSNVLEAAMVGAMEAIPLISGMTANLIAFLSIYSFFNRVLTWIGKRGCFLDRDLSFEFLFSYLLWPVAYTMGVPKDDCLKVAELIGIKTMLNEFVAFERLGTLIGNRDAFIARNISRPVLYLPGGDWQIYTTNSSNPLVTLKYGAFYTHKAGVIATYAICGFANIGSMGIVLGLMAMALPHRRQEVSKLVVTGLCGGTIACALTGSFTGLLYDKTDH